MKIENLKHQLLKISEDTSEEKLGLFVKTTDLYYSIYPLNKLIEYHLESIVSNFDHIDFFADNKRLVRDLSYQINILLRNQLFQYILVHELRIADSAGLLTGSTDSEKRKNYNVLTANTEWLDYLFDKYKYLEARLSINLTNLLEHTNKMISRATKDWEEIKLFLGVSDQKIIKIDLFLGDLHQHGQSVSKLTLKSISILYKPRNQNLEADFVKFLKFLESYGEFINVKVPDFINKLDYSWVRSVANDEVSSLSEIEEFYHTHGQALALFYILGSVDIIDDNIIAVGKYPTIIDMECIISRTAPIDRSSSFTNYFEDSVTGVGVLPTLNIGDNLERDYFGGALHSRGDEKIKTTVWDGLEGMNLKQTPKEIYRVASENEKHLPIFNGIKYGINESYLPFLLKGFSQTLNFFIEYKSEIILFIKTSGLFSKIVFRVLTHPTAVYDKLSRSFLIPEAFQSLNTERNVKAILNRTFNFNTKYINNKIIASIVKQFKEGDIPYFCSYSDSNNLYTSNGELAVINYFKKSKNSTQAILDKLSNLNSQTIQAQLRIIEGTVNFYFHIKHNKFDSADFKQYNNFPVQDLPTSDLLSGVKVIADHLVQTSFTIDGEINWLAKTSNQKDQRYEFTPLSNDIYDGILGIAFFLLYASKYIKNNEYFEVAEKIFLNTKKIFKKQLVHGIFKKLTLNEKQGIPISPLYYPSSILYMMDHFAAFNKKYIDHDFINSYTKFICSVLDENHNWDVLMGKTGLLEMLLNLNKLQKFGQFDSLIKKITHQISNSGVAIKEGCVAWPYTNLVTNEINQFFGGYAHGTAGISLTLIKAAQVLEDKDIEHVALSALKYDRSLFVEEKGIWKDMRELSRVWDSISWCHGSTGIAMSRVYLSNYIEDKNFKKEIQIAVKNIISGKTESDCLCHGRGSDFEVLSLCASYLNDEDLRQYVRNRLLELNEKVVTNTYQMTYGDGNKMEILGLFNGLAGVGYTLLRHFDWENVPSVISLESSACNHKIAHRP